MLPRMPDAQSTATEFGGKPQKNGVQPPPHIPTQSERLMLLYSTGDESGQSAPDGGDTWSGLLPVAKAKEAAVARGVSFETGQVWDELQSEADAAIAELAAE